MEELTSLAGGHHRVGVHYSTYCGEEVFSAVRSDKNTLFEGCTTSSESATLRWGYGSEPRVGNMSAISQDVSSAGMAAAIEANWIEGAEPPMEVAEEATQLPSVPREPQGLYACKSSLANY